MNWDEEDDFSYVREESRHRGRPAAHRFVSAPRGNQQFLDPGAMYNGGAGGAGLMRTRSQGARPNPIVINNEFVQEVAPSPYNPPWPPSPEMRGRGRLGDEFLADEMAEMALENRRLRSRSRGWSDANRRDDAMELELRRRQLAELERKASLEDERERMKHEYELQRLKDEAKRKDAEAEAKAERKRILDEYELEQREKEDKRKEDEKRLRERIRQEEIDKKAKEEKEWNEFMAKLKAKEEKEKADKKKKEEEIDEALRQRLLNAGYSKAYADRIVEEDKVKKSSSTALIAAPLGRPTYVKVHKDYLSVDTLRYYNLPYEWDKTDKNYIIIMREIDQTETDILFEHTKRLRKGNLLLEPAKKEPQYAWVRKRDRSHSRVKKLSIVQLDKD